MTIFMKSSVHTHSMANSVSPLKSASAKSVPIAFPDTVRGYFPKKKRRMLPLYLRFRELISFVLRSRARGFLYRAGMPDALSNAIARKQSRCHYKPYLAKHPTAPFLPP